MTNPPTSQNWKKQKKKEAVKKLMDREFFRIV
jgi:hypothetical protein